MTYQTSFYPKFVSTTNTFIDLNRVLFLKDKRAIQLIDNVRQCSESDRRKAKLQLPVFTPSGTFQGGHQASNLIHYNNLLQFDIDSKDNNYIAPDKMKDMIMQSDLSKYVYYLANSCSNNGIWGLVKTDGTVSDYKPHFTAFSNDLKSIGIVSDNSCSDISRLRFISYDDSPYFAPDSLIYTSTHINTAKPERAHQGDAMAYNMQAIPQQGGNILPKQATPKEVDIITHITQAISNHTYVITHSHQDSLNIIAALCNTFGESGLPFWLTIRQQRNGYDTLKHTNDYTATLKRIASGHNVGNFGLKYIVNKYNEAKREREALS
jgi:hypothetical protein